MAAQRVGAPSRTRGFGINDGSSTVTHRTNFAVEDDYNSLAMGDDFNEEEQEGGEVEEGGEAPAAAADGG